MKSMLAVVATCLLLTACGRNENRYTLYQATVMNPNLRKHVATFDAGDGKDYNALNCRSTQYLYQRQAGADARFWCESGPYRKS